MKINKLLESKKAKEDLEWNKYKITYVTGSGREDSLVFNTWQSDVEYAWRMSPHNIPHTQVKSIELLESKSFYKESKSIKEDASYEWKPNTSFKHIKDIYEKVKANGYKYVNNEREEFMAAVKKADAKGYKPEQCRQIRDWHRDIWAHNRKTESYEGTYSDKFRNLIKKCEEDGISPSGVINDIIRYCPEDALKDLWFDRGYARDFDKDELTEASSISRVEPKVRFKGKSAYTLTKDKKWEVDFDEEGNIVARTRHGRPYYFSGHINDKVNDFPYTDEDNIILAAREQHGIKFGKVDESIKESTDDTVKRWEIDYFIDENDDSDTPLTTYVYTDSKQEAINKVRAEYPNAQIVYCVYENVPAQYKKWDMEESLNEDGEGTQIKDIAKLITQVTTEGSDSEKAQIANTVIDCIPDNLIDDVISEISNKCGNIKVDDKIMSKVTTLIGDTSNPEDVDCLDDILDFIDISKWDPNLVKSLLVTIIGIIAAIEPTPAGELILSIVQLIPANLMPLLAKSSPISSAARAARLGKNISKNIGKGIARKFSKKGTLDEDTAVSSGYDFDDDTDGLSYYYDDELFNDNLENSPYTEIASKSVPDFDGFMTDYTMYMNINTGEYVFILGDKDIYTPEDGNFDWECETEEEAREWFDSYNGYDDDIDESIMNESDAQESPIIHKKSDGSYLIAASNGDGYVAFNRSDVCMGNISANNEVEAKNKFNANKFDE